MRYTCFIFSAAVVMGLTGNALAQGLTASECAQIKRAYGVTPSECRGGAAPLAAAATVPAPPISEPTQEMRHNNIFFNQSRAALDPSSLLQIQKLADFLNAPSMQQACLKLVGHSDSSGGAVVNMEMGAKRASAVQSRLALLLKSPNRIEAVESKGEEQPLSGLPSTSAWQRRVTIWVRKCNRY